MSPIENWVFVLGPIFHLYRGIFARVQMRIFVPVGATVRYKCPIKRVGSPPHPIQMPHICIGWWLCQAEMSWPHIYTGWWLRPV
jgi:hypothetical protein